MSVLVYVLAQLYAVLHAIAYYTQRAQPRHTRVSYLPKPVHCLARGQTTHTGGERRAGQESGRSPWPSLGLCIITQRCPRTVWGTTAPGK